MNSGLTEEEKKFIASGPVDDIKRAIQVGERGYRGIIAQLYMNDSIFYTYAVGALGDRKLAERHTHDDRLLREMMMGAIPTKDLVFVEFLYEKNPNAFKKKIKSLILQASAAHGNYFLFRRVLGSDHTLLDDMELYTPIAKGLNECKEPQIFYYLISEGLMKKETVLGFIEDEKMRSLVATMKLKYPRFVTSELAKEFVDTITDCDAKYDPIDSYPIEKLQIILKLAIEIGSPGLVECVMKRGEFYGDEWLFLAVDADETTDGVSILRYMIKAGPDRKRRISVATSRAALTGKELFHKTLLEMNGSE